MQLIALASAAALVASAAAAASEYNFNASCVVDKPKARVFNRCPYTVHLWSILKGQGCPSAEAAIIKPGDFYQENFREAVSGVGVSLKISKTDKCKGNDVTQLEYYLERANAQYAANYLDVSYVDCEGGDCPSRKEGFYLKSGNENGEFMANSVNEICPILSCSNAAECGTMAYVGAYDRQTKSCNLDANLDFYMCGGEAPDESAPAPEPQPEPSTPAPSSSEAESSAPAPTSSKIESKPLSAAEVQAQAAAITPAPVPEAPKNVKVVTDYVYVTKVEYVNARHKRHGHVHQHFRA